MNISFEYNLFSLRKISPSIIVIIIATIRLLLQYVRYYLSNIWGRKISTSSSSNVMLSFSSAVVEALKTKKWIKFCAIISHGILILHQKSPLDLSPLPPLYSASFFSYSEFSFCVTVVGCFEETFFNQLEIINFFINFWL